jgi:predicted phosphohydrolase
MFHDDFGALPEGDALVHAGDMGRAGGADELSVVAAWLRAQPHKHKIVIAGNHDWLFQGEPERARELFAGLTYLEHEARVIDGVRFFGSPFTPVFYDWAFMLPRGAALADKWADIPAGLDVLITHGPPHGILDDAARYRDGVDARGPRPAGCEALRDRVRIAKPRVHIFGHIHNNQGVVDDDGVRYVNCTTNESELPPVIVDV